jgi:hypothetical protein
MVRRAQFLAIGALLAVLASGCVDRLPDQDLRITTTTTAFAKLSASDLWKEFAADPSAARSRYFGNAVDVTDRVTRFDANPPAAHVFFGQTTEHGVRAQLLDERAAQTIKDVKAGDRITLRCFVEGLGTDGNVVLKSCIRP